MWSILEDYLHRRLTPAERQAVRVADRLIREAICNCRAEKYQLEQETAQIDREVESLKMKAFVAQWQGAEETEEK